MAQKIVIVDYGMGNLNSVRRKLERLKTDCEISNDPQIIAKADKLILPGVGHFGKAMQNISSNGILEILQSKVLQEKTPILGICLGMQLMCNSSTEGNAQGLGWIDASVEKFNVSEPQKFKIPHMGWNTILFMPITLL
jgi:imidazole glycerol-phosphate synthase subunit HisH